MSAEYPSTFPKLFHNHYGPNLQEFKQRFDHLQGKFWLKNLYFVYLLELRALQKASEFLKSHRYYTGDDIEDELTQNTILEILAAIEKFPGHSHFDEKIMFVNNENNAAGGGELLAEFRAHFHNISLIMDCVGCDKCKLWGKLQITGLGTAFKILFAPPPVKQKQQKEEKIQYFNNEKMLQLSRNEIVALFNGFGRISMSIRQLENFRLLM